MIALPKLPTLPTLSRQERWLAIGCGLVLVVMALDRLILTPWIRHTTELRTEIRTLEQAVANQQRLVAAGPWVTAEMALYRDYLRAGGAGDSQMATLLKEVEDLARQSQVSVETVKPLPGTESETVASYGFEVLCEGLLPQWVRFIYLIETSPWLFHLDRASLELKEGGNGLLKGSLRCSTMVVKHP